MPESLLQRGTPESQGIPSASILRFVEGAEQNLHELHSFMLLRHGVVVAEGWWAPYAPPHPHMLFSLSKSFTSTGVGLAAAEGYLSIDDRVLDFFPREMRRRNRARTWRRCACATCFRCAPGMKMIRWKLCWDHWMGIG